MNIHVPEQTAIQLWFTAQELADAALSGLISDMPATKQGINDHAKRYSWNKYRALYKTETGRGGTITRYHVELLPLHVRIEYFTRFIHAEPADCRRSLVGTDNLTERALLARDARLAIVRMADRFRRMSGMNAVTADGLFIDVYNAGRVDVPVWVREEVGTLSPRSLMRWRTKERVDGGDALGHDPSLARKGTGLLDTANDGAVRLTILGWIARSTALSADVIRGYIEDEYGDELVAANGELKPLPPERTFQHFIKQVRVTEKIALMNITNPDRFRSTGMLVGTGAYSWVCEPNQLWMIDASPADVLLKDGRWTIYKCIDIFTRRCVITLSKTPRASAVALMIRKTILAWGAPKTIKTDNGSDFVANEIERLFSALNIDPDPSKAYSPAEKGHIERAIKTFQHEVCPQLPGYIGHNVAERKAIEERKSFAQRLGASNDVLFEVSLTAAALQEQIDDWLEHIYHQRKHGGLGKRTPSAVAASSNASIERVDERALDMLLMPAPDNNGIRTMTKQGIKVDHNYYLTGSIMVGTSVFVRLDPIDMGKIYVYSADGSQFLDEAICPKLSNIDRAAFVAAKKRENAEMVAERVRPIKAEVRRLQRGPSGLERTIALAKRKTAERNAACDNVIRLPKREETRSTPQIAAALDAIALPKNAHQPKSLNEKAAQLHAALVREAENKDKSTVIHLDPDASLTEAARRFKWAVGVDAEIAAGVVVDDDTAIKLARYKATPQYQTGVDCLTSFGLENTLRMLR